MANGNAKLCLSRFLVSIIASNTQVLGHSFAGLVESAQLHNNSKIFDHAGVKDFLKELKRLRCLLGTLNTPQLQINLTFYLIEFNERSQLL